MLESYSPITNLILTVHKILASSDERRSMLYALIRTEPHTLLLGYGWIIDLRLI